MYSSRSLQICPLLNRIHSGSRCYWRLAGAPFPHCGAAHGASGGRSARWMAASREVEDEELFRPRFQKHDVAKTKS